MRGREKSARKVAQPPPVALDPPAAAPLKLPFAKDRAGADFFLPDIGALASYNPKYMTTAHCVASDFYSTQFVEFCARIGSAPRLHRKLWEFAFVYENLRRYGAIRPGSRGVGFGVGEEPMPALFIAEGCTILATDAPAEISGDWIATEQWSDGTKGLFWPQIAPDALVRERLTFQFCDMNAVPDFEEKFDFSWSACCFEHLGSIRRGFDFIIDSVEKCLVPGGVSCHTSELNLTSNEHTMDHESTVLFRRRDVEELAAMLRDRGHDVALGRFDPGNSFIDGLIDLPPFSDSPHLRLQLERYATTSFGLAVRRKR